MKTFPFLVVMLFALGVQAAPPSDPEACPVRCFFRKI